MISSPHGMLLSICSGEAVCWVCGPQKADHLVHGRPGPGPRDQLWEGHCVRGWGVFLPLKRKYYISQTAPVSGEVILQCVRSNETLVTDREIDHILSRFPWKILEMQHRCTLSVQTECCILLLTLSQLHYYMWSCVYKLIVTFCLTGAAAGGTQGREWGDVWESAREDPAALEQIAGPRGRETGLFWTHGHIQEKEPGSGKKKPWVSYMFQNAWFSQSSSLGYWFIDWYF